MHPKADLGIVWECDDLKLAAQTAHSTRR